LASQICFQKVRSFPLNFGQQWEKANFDYSRREFEMPFNQFLEKETFPLHLLNE
jgi:hypothetical protein